MTAISIPAPLELRAPEAAPVPLAGVLSWDSAAPIEVHLTILHDAGETVWLIGRDLLTAGLHGTAGEGDVRIKPHPSEAHIVQIDLSSDNGFATLTLRRQVLGDFLSATWVTCPADREVEVIRAALDVFDWTTRYVDTEDAS